ncbi:MAG: hypothetical protein ACKOS8_07525 [Gemmataceae bacterium]
MSFMALASAAMVPALAPIEALGHMVPSGHGRVIAVFTMLALGEASTGHRMASATPAALMTMATLPVGTVATLRIISMGT